MPLTSDIPLTMPDILLYVAIANLLICLGVGVPLFFGSRRLRRLSDIPLLEGNASPKVSVIVAARNEEQNIEQSLRSLLRLDYEPLELLVVNDRSTDRTGEILDRVAGENPRLNVVHLTELPAGWLGKNHAMFYGANRATGEILLFTDADMVMEPTVLRRAVRYLVERQLDHLPILFQVRMPSWLLESFIVTFHIYLMTYCKPWNCPNPKSSAHIGVGGFNMVRADAYRAMGTHEAIRMRPDDDVKLGKLVKKLGFRQECLNGVDLIYVPWYSSLREMVIGMEKNAFSGVDYNVGYLLLAATSVVLFNVFPFIAIFLTHGLTWWVYVAVVAILLGMGLDSAYFTRLRLSCCLGFPLAASMFVFVQLRTMILNLWQGGIRWRDTHYSLRELRANRV